MYLFVASILAKQMIWNRSSYIEESSKNCGEQLDGSQLLKESLHYFTNLLFRVTRKVTLCTTID